MLINAYIYLLFALIWNTLVWPAEMTKKNKKTNKQKQTKQKNPQNNL